MAVIVILVTVLGIGAIGTILNLSLSGPLQVPPPLVLPTEIPDTIASHGLEVFAEAGYWQDFMPTIVEEGVSVEGPPFYTAILVNITNNGNTTVSDFEAVRMTIYYFNNSNIALITFRLTLVGDSLQIGPGENIVLAFTNDRGSIFSPTIDEGTNLYSRILVSWGDGIEEILTTPPSALGYTH